MSEVPQTQKRCPKCGLTKELVAGFHRANNTKDGRHSICKPCRIAHNMGYAKTWREKKKAAAKDIVDQLKRNE